MARYRELSRRGGTAHKLRPQSTQTVRHKLYDTNYKTHKFYGRYYSDLVYQQTCTCRLPENDIHIYYWTADHSRVQRFSKTKACSFEGKALSLDTNAFLWTQYTLDTNSSSLDHKGTVFGNKRHSLWTDTKAHSLWKQTLWNNPHEHGAANPNTCAIHSQDNWRRLVELNMPTNQRWINEEASSSKQAVIWRWSSHHNHLNGPALRSLSPQLQPKHHTHNKKHSKHPEGSLTLYRSTTNWNTLGN